MTTATPALSLFEGGKPPKLVPRRYHEFTAERLYADVARACGSVIYRSDQDGTAYADTVCVYVEPSIQRGSTVGGRSREECTCLDDEVTLINECGIVEAPQILMIW